ncbi:hypothetical protein AYJ54_36050 [Bradyrhizobium centrolobii]|uniref:GP-PDE domain-containing protein n=3 Tax=Nitrobacteraceae TaxID=41294 RepID=A0A176YZF4_9BRAD|nr:hypothetical protein AYJ54_36050 [Bradyrhizobium centrolobii]OAF13133.1 hypothetical protein AXW67_18815 [Bradyrhizobium neotropicale]
MKHSTSASTEALVKATLALTLMMATTQASEYNTDKIGDVLKNSRKDFTLVCAHRGLYGMSVGRNREINHAKDVPQNSRAAMQTASDDQIECSEIGLRSNKSGDFVVLHNSNLGRTTNVGSRNGKSDYDPYTGTAYNPSVLEYPVAEELHLRTSDLTTGCTSK